MQSKSSDSDGDEAEKLRPLGIQKSPPPKPTEPPPAKNVSTAETKPVEEKTASSIDAAAVEEKQTSATKTIEVVNGNSPHPTNVETKPAAADDGMTEISLDANKGKA